MANSFVNLYKKSLADRGLIDETPDILLTKEFGDVVQRENPALFSQFPDFGEEWSRTRDANAPSLAGEFGRAMLGSTKSLGATAVGAGALLTGSDRLRDVAESIDQSAAQDAPTITSLEDIAPGRSTVGKIFSKDAVRYGVSRLGQAVPSLVEAVGTGLIGAGLGTVAAPGAGTVAGAAAGVVGRQVVKQSIRQLLKKASTEGAESVAEGLVRRGIIREATEEGIEQGLMKGIPEVAEIVSRQARAQAGRLGANTANALNSYLLSAGEIYNETPDRALALGLGALSAIPDTILPARILNRLFPDVAKDEAQDLAKNYVARLAKEALTTVGIEGTTEGFQEAVNLVARNLNADRPVFEFDDDDVKRLREAAIGGVAGGVLAAPSILTQRSNTVPPPPPPPATPATPASIITPGAPILPTAAPVAPAPVNVSRKVALMSAEQQAQRLAELRQITQLSPLEQQEQQLLTAFVGDQTTSEPSAPAPVVQEATVPQAVPETFVAEAPAEALSLPVAEDQDFVYTVSDYGTGTKSVQLDLRSQADQNRDGANGQWANNPQSWRELGRDVPDVPGWLPQGQYTLAQVRQAIAEGPPPATANNPRPVATEAKVVNPEQETPVQPEIVKKPKALRDLEKALAKDGVEMKVVPYSDDTLHLFHVYVEPVDRKLGKGTNALRQLTAYADSVQQPITLTAIPENKGDETKLAKLYTGLGFTQTGVESQTKAAQFRREPSVTQPVTGSQPLDPLATPLPVVEAPQLNPTPQAPAPLIPSATPNVGVPRPFEFGPIIEGPESMDFRSDERVANLTPQQLVQGIPALMKGNLDVSGNRSRTRSAIILQTPDGRMIMAGAIMPQNTTNLRGEPVTGNKLSVQRMSAIARQDKKYSKAIYEGGKNSALLSDVIAAGYRPIGYVAFNQKPGTIFQSFANEQHFDQSWGLTDKTTGRLGKRVLHEGQPLTEAIRQTTNISELREVESRIDRIGQELQAAQGTARDELVAEYEQLSARQQQLFDRDQSQTGTDELKYRTSAEAAMYANKAQQFQQAAARLAQLGARVDVFATEVLRQQLPGQPNVTGVQYSPWHIAVGLEDVQNANISNLVTLLHEGVHSLYGRLPLRTQGLILTAAQESMAELRAKAEAARAKTGVPLAEFDGNIEELFAETMAQRLAADGVPDGRSMVDALIRWVRDLYYRVTMAVQAAFGKTPDSKTALTWIENQFRRELGGDYEWAFINLLNKLLPESVVGQAQRFAMVGGTPGGVVNFVDPLTLKSVQPEAVSDTTGAIGWNAKYRTDGTPDQEIPGDEARARVESAAVNEELRAISEIKAQVAPDMAPESWWATVGRGQSPQTRLDSINQLAEGAALATIGGERMTDPMNAQAKLKALILLTRMQRQQVNRKAKLDTQITEASDELLELASGINVMEGNMRDADMHTRTLRTQLKQSIRSLVRNNRRGYGMAEINGGLIEAIREAENLSENDMIPEAYQNFLRRFMNTDESLFDELSAIAQLDLSLGTMKIYDVVRAVEAQADSSPILKKLVDDRPRLVALSALARDNAEQLDLIQLGRMKDTERFLEIKAELDQIRQADEQTLARMLAENDKRAQQSGLAQRTRTAYLKRRAALRRKQRFIQRAESQSEVLDKTQQALNPYIADLQSKGPGAHNDWSPVEGAKWTAMSLQSDGSWSRTERTLEYNQDGTLKDADRTLHDLVENAQWIRQHQEKEGQAFYELVKRQTYELKTQDFKKLYPAQWRTMMDRMVQPLGEEAVAIGHSSGARVQQMMNQWQFIMESHQSGTHALSKHWTHDLQALEKSTGITDHGTFFSQIFDQVMYYLGSEPGLDEQAAIRNATRQARARLVTPPAENFNQQFEQFLRRTKEINESFVKIAEQYGVFIEDPRLGKNLRKAVAQGWLTNMRSMRGEVLQTIMHDMQNAGWKLEMVEETKPDGKTSKRITRATTFDSLTEEQTADPDQLRQTLAPLFTPQIINSWLTPFMNKPGVPVFIYNGRPISQLLLQDAWASSGGDLVKTIDLLSQSVGLEPTENNPDLLPAFRLSILKQIDRLYGMEAKLAHDASQTRSLFDPMGPKGNMLMDARLNELIPPEHLQFQTFEAESSRALLGTLAFHGAFGRNGERMVATLNEMKSILSLRNAQWESLKGTSKASRMADATARGLDYKDLQRASKGLDDAMALQAHLDTLFGFQNQSGPLGDARAGLETLGFMVSQIVNNPKTALLNLISLTERVVTQRSLGPDTIRATAETMAGVTKHVFGSLLETLGIHIINSSDYAKILGNVEGYAIDRLPLGVAMSDIGKNGKFQNSFSDKWIIRPIRGLSALQRRGVSGPGAPREFGRLNVLPLVGNVMNYFSQAAAIENGAGNVRQFERMVVKAMKFYARNPEKLNDSAFRFSAKDLGMNNKMGFGDEGVFNYYRQKTIEFKVGNFEDTVKDAMVRSARGERLLTDESVMRIGMMANNELNLDSSINTRPVALTNNPALKFGLPLLGWPIAQMNKINRLMKTEDGQAQAAAMIKTLGRLAIWSLPMGVAFTLWMDWYDEKFLKKKSNMAAVDWRAAVPIVGPAWALMSSEMTPYQNFMGILERGNRAGNIYGIGSDVVTQIVSPALDPASGQRAFSLDQRILVMSQFLQINQALNNFINTDFTHTWATVDKPLISAMGGNGFFHSLDMVNNFFGMDNAQSRMTKRSSVNAWLRSAGRTTGVELKRGDFGGSPTPVTVHVRQMQLAAYGNDRVQFMESYRQAVNASREMGSPDPEKAVLASWRSRDPLEVFRSKPTEHQMSRLYQTMDDEGDQAVREALKLYKDYTALIAPSKFEAQMNRRLGQQMAMPKMPVFGGSPMLVR